jgi:uncharacterized delta-60 repeat protein
MWPVLATAVLFALVAGAAVSASGATASSPTAGSLDPSYGSGGAVLDDFFGTQDPDQANAVLIQPDGKIVVAGSTGTGGFSPVAMVARYNSNGTRDPSFGPPPHGFLHKQVCFSSTCGEAEADAIAPMSNGDLVVAGVAVNNESFFVMRLTPSGALDSTFAGGGGSGYSFGIAAFQLGGVATGYHVGGVAVQADGNIVVDGTYNSPTQAFIARIPKAGGSTLDPTWNGGSGFSNRSSGTGFSALALQPSDGKAVAVGTDSSSHELLIARYTTAGIQDSTFHAVGGNEAQIGSGPDTGAALVATNDGRLIAAGTDGALASAGIGLFQFKQADGSLDTSFASTGDERVALPGGDAASVTALALDGSGRLLIAGQDITKGHTFVARLSAAGALDSSFGSGGFSIPATGSSDGAQAVAADSSANPVVAGFGTPTGASDTDAMTARLLGTTPSGPPTTSGSTGTTSTPAGNPATPSLSHMSQAHSTWSEHAAPKRAHGRKSTIPVGTAFFFTLNVPATVTFEFTQLKPGNLARHKCIAPSKHNHKNRSCPQHIKRGALVLTSTAGAHRVPFAGRLRNGRLLPAGAYMVTITASASGRQSPTRSLNFTIAG